MLLRDWQQSALEKWREHRRGIIEVVTGAGKTFFALACVQDLKPETTLIVVPTTALLDQWWEKLAALRLRLDDIHIISGSQRIRSGTINIAVLNTAAKLQEAGRTVPCCLIVDECHKAATPSFKAVLEIPKIASLGLSATPERQYDSGLDELLVPTLGPVIFRYSYKEALRDGVIVPFNLRNIVFELEEENQKAYDKLTGAIARSAKRLGIEAHETIALLLKRARLLNLSTNRIRLTLKIVSSHRDQKIIVFHEDIHACNIIQNVLEESNVRAGVYHSRLPLRKRAEVLTEYRQGKLNVLVTCRALDEGFNVPETEIGVIAASTATRRQRIQRTRACIATGVGKEKRDRLHACRHDPGNNAIKAGRRRIGGSCRSGLGAGMRTFVVGDCLDKNKFQLWDPDASRETEFEMLVARALSCVYPSHVCVMFSGGFQYDDRVYRPDMALIAKDFSHWFIIEVELVTHSFYNHVLPQVRAFQYGEAQSDCINSLVASKLLTHQQAGDF